MVSTMTANTHAHAHSHSEPAAPDAARERLSALLDGELDAETAREALKRQHHTPGDADALAEYAYIGDALRGLAPAATRPDFTARCMARLADEPTLLAPLPRRAERAPMLWAAAAAVSVLSWGLWSMLPPGGDAARMAQAPAAIAPVAARTADVSTAGVNAADADKAEIEALLRAHQDFAQAVIAPTDMQLTQVSALGAGQ